MIIRLLRLSGLNKIPVHEENKLLIYNREIEWPTIWNPLLVKMKKL